jgi:hypothetical protein
MPPVSTEAGRWSTSLPQDQMFSRSSTRKRHGFLIEPEFSAGEDFRQSG